VTLPESESDEEIFHEPREGIWQPSDKELKFGEEAAEEPDSGIVKKRPKKKDKDLKSKKAGKGREEPEIKKVKEPKKEKTMGKPKTITCKCGGKIVIKSSKRPIKIECPECGRTGTLKK
jgi:hypothetical protein